METSRKSIDSWESDSDEFLKQGPAVMQCIKGYFQESVVDINYRINCKDGWGLVPFREYWQCSVEEIGL